MLSKIHFNIGVVGFLSQGSDESVYKKKVTRVLGQIRDHVIIKERELLN